MEDEYNLLNNLLKLRRSQEESSDSMHITEYLVSNKYWLANEHMSDK